MKSQVEKVTSLLDMESNDVRSIGIWGMGGIGKTEIASVIYETHRHRFEASCFLGDVGTSYQKNGLTWLAKVVIRKLLGEKMTLTSEREGLIILKNRLRWKKVLFILDDVNHLEQLEFLVGEPEWFGMGSKIILTSRDKHLLISHVGDNVYEVQLLTEDEALELFSRHAFREKSPLKDFVELSRQVVKYAGGLPLALKVLGSSFYKRDKRQWRDKINRLKRIPNNDILGKLRLSFDGLDKDEKEIFLDIAFLDITGLTRYNFKFYVELVTESRGFQLIGIDCLIEKSLLSIDIHNGIVMHNMIREMGANVIRKEYVNSRVWLPEEVRDLFKGKLIPEKVESLHIPKGYNFEDDPITYSNIFRRMQSLQVLIIGDGTFSSNCAITYLPSSLLFIEWQGYPSISLPESFEPSELAMLHLERSRLVELWPISKKLSNLKHLDLGESLGLTKTPNFGDMPNLETLNLNGCQNLEEVHPSLGHCRTLTDLNLHGCHKLKKLPKFVSMESLEFLSLYKCTSLEEFPEICGDMRRLSILEVESPWIRSLPPSLSGLGCLLLKDCEVLESIPDTIRNLKNLSIESCNRLAMLPNSLFESQQLEWLHICRCSELVELPISLGVQKKIARLILKECENLKKLPSSIQMESLEEVMISNCRKLDTFPEINGDIHSLTRLTITCMGIRELPSSIRNLRGLKSLALKGCRELVSLPDNLCNLKNLTYLTLWGCKKLEKLPENIGHLQQLKLLDASDTAISQPPPSITKLGELRILTFSHVLQHVQHSSSFVFPQLSALSSLRDLNLANLDILGGLPEDLGSLTSLERLDVSGSNISCLPKSIKELLHLVELHIHFCQNLNELPGELPPNLKELYADYHLASKSIRDPVIKCLKLHLLSISWCGPQKSKYGTGSTCQVNVLKSLQHLTRTCIQCDFHQRDSFLIFFPKATIPELFNYQIINHETISINLNPSWYTDKFMGFSICFSPDSGYLMLVATLVCKSDPERKHSLKYDRRVCLPQFSSVDMCFFYIPFETLWHASDNKEGKNPNDYCLFEVSTKNRKELCWGISLEYENKDTAMTTEFGCSMVLEQPEPSLASSSRASAEHDIAIDRGLCLGYEHKALEVDQAAVAAQNEHESQNVELIRVCDSPSRKMGDASRKRKRKRKRKRNRNKKKKDSRDK
ncbi:disease resistance protein Roq1-like isoform X2 [Lycium barbarum]|nr:disease resistance protein Roq1-like isoform X2 [Lycium barbarum]